MKTKTGGSSIPAFEPYPTRDSASVLGRLLRAAVWQNERSPLDEEFVRAVLETALTVSATVGFDPNERLHDQERPVHHPLLMAENERFFLSDDDEAINERGHSYTVSVLGTLLCLKKPPEVEIEPVKWPTDPGAFNVALHDRLGRPPISVDWVAAAWAAAGADAWSDPPGPDGLPWAVGLAAGRGCPGLLKIFLAQPTAWSAHAIGERATSAFWQMLAYFRRSVPCLRVLLEHGVRPAEVVEALPEGAGVNAVEAYVRSGALEKIPAPQLDAIVRSLEASEEKSDLLMQAVQQGPQVNAVLFPLLRAHAAAFAQVPAERALAPFDPTSWSDRWEGDGSEMLGQWSLLGALALGQLKALEYETLSSWCLEWEVPRQPTDLFVAIHKAGPNATLAGAMGFDWRPGIAMEGMVMLAVLGHHQGSRSTRFGSLRKKFARAAGIDNLEQWAHRHRAAAIAVTQALLLDGGNPARTNLNMAWWLALKRMPSLADALLPEEKDRLLALLETPDALTYQNGYHVYPEVAKCVYPPDVLADPMRLPPGPQRRSAWRAKAGLMPISTLLATASSPPWADDPWVRAWVVSKLKGHGPNDREAAPCWEHVRRWDRMLVKKKRLEKLQQNVDRPCLRGPRL